MENQYERTWSGLLDRLNIEHIHDEMLQAFVHPTYAAESSIPVPDNQRLEFLGDAVLGLIAGELLYKKYPKKDEGELSSIRGVAVSETTLSTLAQELGFPDLLQLGRGEERSGGRYRTSTLADAFEAFLGAVYLTEGFEATRRFLTPFIEPVIEDIIGRGYKDPKTTLQEMVQERYKKNISYRLLEERGPDHEKEFTCGVVWEDEIIALGRGKSKKEAQRQAAIIAIEFFNCQL